MPSKRTRSRRPLAVWWWFVFIATLITLSLSCASFPAYLAKQGEDLWSATILLESAYRSLQLFVLTWDPPAGSGTIPISLQIARFLAAIVALSTVIVALLQLFRERIGLLYLRRQRNHVVLCGLGERGLELVRDLRAKRQKVVIIEGQEDHPDLVSCRAMGALVLIGSPLDTQILAQARVDRASTLLSLYQEDAASVETLMGAYQLNRHRSPGTTLRCILQIYDHEMRSLLETYEIFKPQRSAVRLELFNLFDIGAQWMLRETPGLFRQAEPRRLLIIGMGWLGQMLLQRALRSWRIDRLAEQQAKRQAPPDPTAANGKADTLEVIVIDRDCQELESRLAANKLTGIDGCTVTFHEMDVLGIDFLAANFAPLPDNGTPIDSAFVCLPDDRLALLTAIRLRDRFPNLPLVVRMTTRSGGAGLLTTHGPEAIQVVGLMDLASTMPLVTNSSVEMIAREIHRDYVLGHFAHGETAEQNSSLVPWHMLDEVRQESNRELAADVDTKLTGIHCEKYPVTTPDELFEFTDDDVEWLARQEHSRWYEAHQRKGFRYGPVKDIANKVSPSFVPKFDDLPESSKKYNRMAMRRMPVWLAKAGFGIRRRAPAVM